MSASHIFFTASSKLSEQGGTELISDEPPPNSWIASFDWDRMVEMHLPFDTPFQIKFQVGQYKIGQCIFDEGASVSIFFALAW